MNSTELLIVFAIVIVFLGMYVTYLKISLRINKDIINMQAETIDLITDHHNELLAESVTVFLKISERSEDYETAQKCKEFLDKHIYKN